MKTRLLIFACLLACVNLALNGQSRPAATVPASAWAALWTTSTPSTQAVEDVLNQVGSPAAIKALIRDDVCFPAAAPNYYGHRFVVDTPAGPTPTTLYVRIPEGYSPRKAYPLIIAGHGTDGNGYWAIGMVEEMLGEKEVENFIIAGPTLPGPKVYNGKPYQEQTYLLMLQWLWRNIHIDHQRTYITGYSQGGHIAWHTAVMYPRLLAAAVPLAGVPWFEGSPYNSDSYLENAMHVPIWAIWGEKDRANDAPIATVDLCRLAADKFKVLKKTDFVGTELPGTGHGDCEPKVGELLKFIADRRREVTPEKFTHFFHLPQHARGYYVEAIKFSHPPIDFDKPSTIRISPTPGRPPTTMETYRAVQTQLEKQMYSLKAQLDRQANSLSIQAVGISAVRVYVMDGMFDLSRPVTINFAGKTWRGTIESSPRCTLTHYLRERDPDALVVNEVEIDDAGKAAVKYK